MIDNSYYIILNRLKAFANGHYLINTFTYHEIANFDISKNPEYPIMHAVPVSMNPVKGAINYSFDITFASWVRAKEDKQENEVTVISDMHRCALDLVTEITNGNILFGDEVRIDGDAVILPFIDEFANVLSGVTLQLTIQIPYDWSACDIPANWVEGTGDIPDFGGRSLTLDVLDEGTFVVAARAMDFRGSAVTVTYEGNKAIVTITGGGGGGAVDSVNGQTGVVVLDAADVGADASGSADAALTSANSYTDDAIDALTIVESVTGYSVDNTDPLNPIVKAIPLAGTVSGSPVTGDIELEDTVATIPKKIYSTDGSVYETKLLFDEESAIRIESDNLSTGGNSWHKAGLDIIESQFQDGTYYVRLFTDNTIIYNIKSDNPAFIGLKYGANYSANYDLLSLIALQDMKSRIWTKAGAPTVSDDVAQGYLVGSLIWDTTNSILYKCTDNTGGAAVWAVAISGGGVVDSVNGQTGVVVLDANDIGLGNVDNTSDANKPISTATQAAIDAIPTPIYLELIRTGTVVSASVTRYATEGLAGLQTGIVVTIAPKKLFTTFRVFMSTAQPASGSLTVTRKFYNVAGTEIGSQSLVIPASSVAGIYEYTGATYDMSATNGSYGFTIVNAATSSSGNCNSIESVYQ